MSRRVTREKEAALAAVDKVYAPDVVVHGLGEDIHGLENLKQVWSEFYDAFPDLQWTFDDRIVKGDKVVTRFTITGTHKSEYMDIQPTNKKVTYWGIEIFRRAGRTVPLLLRSPYGSASFFHYFF